MVGNERTILVLLFFVYFFWKKLFTIEKFVGCIQRMCNGNYGCNLVLFPSSILFRHHSIIESLLNDSLSILSCVIFSPLMLSSLKMSKWFPFSCVRSFPTIRRLLVIFYFSTETKPVKKTHNERAATGTNPIKKARFWKTEFFFFYLMSHRHPFLLNWTRRGGREINSPNP